MEPNLIRSYQLPTTLDSLIQTCWNKREFYERFLLDKLKDIGVEIEDWRIDEGKPHVKVRNIKSFHPSKISFPGLPSHAEVILCLLLPLI
jgi:hypothetical protein